MGQGEAGEARNRTAMTAPRQTTATVAASTSSSRGSSWAYLTLADSIERHSSLLVP
jgi:hypothetical protein